MTKWIAELPNGIETTLDLLVISVASKERTASYSSLLLKIHKTFWETFGQNQESLGIMSLKKKLHTTNTEDLVDDGQWNTQDIKYSKLPS